MTRLVSLVATRQEVLLHTNPVYPPVPLRRWDWVAIDDNTLDYTSFHARGPSEAAAIDALFDELEAA